MAGERRFLGRNNTSVSRQRVYRVEDALEIDEIGLTEITRSRVYFDEVLLITHHRTLGVGFLVSTGIAAALLGLVTLLLLAEPETVPAGVFMLFLTAPFAVAFVLRLLLQVDVVTVYGRRTRAIMRFGLAKSRGREVFRNLCRSVESKQEEIAAVRAAQEAPPPEEAPPPPPDKEPPPLPPSNEFPGL